MSTSGEIAFMIYIVKIAKFGSLHCALDSSIQLCCTNFTKQIYLFARSIEFEFIQWNWLADSIDDDSAFG